MILLRWDASGGAMLADFLQTAGKYGIMKPLIRRGNWYCFM